MKVLSIRRWCVASSFAIFVCGFPARVLARRLVDDERAYVHVLAEGLESTFLFFAKHAKAFTDKNDKTSYRAYVTMLSNEIEKFDREVMPDVTRALDDQNASELLHEVLSIVHELFDALVPKLKELRDVLQRPEYMNAKNDSKKALELCLKIKPYLLYFTSPETVSFLDGKLGKLHGVLVRAGEEDLAARLGIVKNAVRELRNSKPVDHTIIVNCMTRRIRYNT